jgi:hypothetical protein
MGRIFHVHKVIGMDLIAYSTRMTRRYQTLGILNIYDIFILDHLGTSSIGVWRLILPVQPYFTSLRLVLCASWLMGLLSYFQ